MLSTQAVLRSAQATQSASDLNPESLALQADALSIRPTDRPFESTSVDTTPVCFVSAVFLFLLLRHFVFFSDSSLEFGIEIHRASTQPTLPQFPQPTESLPSQINACNAMFSQTYSYLRRHSRCLLRWARIPTTQN